MRKRDDDVYREIWRCREGFKRWTGLGVEQESEGAERAAGAERRRVEGAERRKSLEQTGGLEKRIKQLINIFQRLNRGDEKRAVYYLNVEQTASKRLSLESRLELRTRAAN